MWAFNLRRKVDSVTGLEIDVSTTASNSLLLIKPDPFQMAFVPRSEARRVEIIDNWKRADEKDRTQREAFAKAAALERSVMI